MAYLLGRSFPTVGIIFSPSALSFVRKIEATFSSEILMTIYEATWCCRILGGSTLCSLSPMSKPQSQKFLNYRYVFLYQELVPPETHSEFANSRDQIRIILNGISRLKQIADVLALRSHG
jgi:hypothetical protein